MKSAVSSIALVASILSAVSASPLHLEQRAADIQFDIVTEVQVETAWATVFATEGAPAPTTTSEAAPVFVAETTTAAVQKGRTRTHNWHTTISTTSTSEYVAPVPETTSVYVAPPTTTEAPLPAFEPPTTSVTYVAPTITPPIVIPLPATTASPVPAAAPTFAPSVPSAYTGDDSYSSANMELAIINSTNVYRKMFQAAPVSWNQSLVDMAVASVGPCVFDHTNPGQNLAAGYDGPQSAVGAWGDEYHSFNFLKPDFGENTGHFTQLVWQDTTTVGCAAKHCPTDGSTSASGWYLICNYFPVGNMLGEFDANVKSMV